MAGFFAIAWPHIMGTDQQLLLVVMEVRLSSFLPEVGGYAHYRLAHTWLLPSSDSSTCVGKLELSSPGLSCTEFMLLRSAHGRQSPHATMYQAQQGVHDDPARLREVSVSA